MWELASDRDFKVKVKVKVDVQQLNPTTAYYYEWLPTWLPYGEQKPEIYRSFDFGNLLSLHMLDTRVIGCD